MSNDRGTNSQSNSRSSKRGKRSGNQKNNYQDKAMEREYNKGKRFEQKKLGSDPTNATCPVRTNSADNDYSWYKPNDQLLKDVATWPMTEAIGLPAVKNINVKPIPDQPLSRVRKIGVVSPGIAVLELVPTIGVANDNTDPVNLAANQLFSHLQSKSGRTPSYSAADVGITILGVAELYSYFVWMTRIYGCASDYNNMSRYQPEAVVTAMGVDWNDVRANLANFREYINQFAYRLMYFPIPKSIDYFKRKIFIYQSIYTDANTNKPQLYMYNPKGFLAYGEGPEGTTTGLAQLTYEQLPGQYDLRLYVDDPVPTEGLMTVKQIMTWGDNLYNPMRGSEDVRLIMSDILNTFGDAGTVDISPISETYVVKPVYSAEVLMQIENAFVYPPSSGYICTVTQNTEINNGCITSKPQVVSLMESGRWNYNKDNAYMFYNTQHAMVERTKLLNFHKDTVTPEDIMVATRLASNFYTVEYSGSDATHSGVMIPSTCGTELCLNLRVFYFRYNNDDAGNTGVQLYMSRFNSDTPGAQTRIQTSTGTFVEHVWSVARCMAILSSFDWAPQIKMVDYGEPGVYTYPYISVSPPFVDLENWTTMDSDHLAKINRVAIEGCSLQWKNKIWRKKR